MLQHTLLPFAAAAALFPAITATSTSTTLDPQEAQALEAQDERPNPMARYQALAEARDREGLAELWGSMPSSILPIFDGDLEGALATWEESPDAPDQERIDALLARAVFAAEVASEVTGRPIFVDYATSFAGWDTEQKRSFRAGQKAFGAAARALGEGNAEAALAAAVECHTLALPLGDWWGAAMGLDAEGRSLLALERPAEALTPASRARLLYSQLGLSGSELGSTILVADCCEALERWGRARAALAGALELAPPDAVDLRTSLEARLTALDERMGSGSK